MIKDAVTARGWTLLAAAAALAIAGAVIGIFELDALAAAFLAMFVAAAMFSHLGPLNLTVTRTIRPPVVAQGSPVTAVAKLINTGRFPTGPLTLVDQINEHSPVEVQIDPLRPGQGVRGNWTLPYLPRGIHLVGPLAVERTDPLGLTRRVTPLDVDDQRVVVHPAVEAAVPPPLGVGSESVARGRSSIRWRHEEFAGLREYRPGDDLRRLHWASFARLGTLMVREDESHLHGSVCLVVDVRADMWPRPADLERALSVAASLCTAALDSGCQVRVATSSGGESGIGAGESHRSRIMEVLAGAQTHPPAPDLPLTFGAAPLPRSGSLIIVTSAERDHGELERLPRSGDATITRVVILPPGGKVGASSRAAMGVVLLAPEDPISVAAVAP